MAARYKCNQTGKVLFTLAEVEEHRAKVGGGLGFTEVAPGEEFRAATGIVNADKPSKRNKKSPNRLPR